MPLGAFKSGLMGAAGGGADYVWNPIGYVHTDGSTGDGTPQNFQFNNIPQDYKYLVLQMGIHGGSSSNNAMKLTLNGTSTSGHYHSRCDYQNGTMSGFFGATNTGWLTGGLGYWEGLPASLSRNNALRAEYWFLHYNDSNLYTTIRGQGIGPIDGSSYWSFWNLNGKYNVSSAITSIQINNSDYFGQNCILSLYGVQGVGAGGI